MSANVKTNLPPQHWAQPWSQQGSELMIGTQPISRLALRAQGDAFYAYDRIKLAKTAAELRQLIPARVEIHYAMKANPFPPLVQWMVPRVDGIDVASERELKVALDAGAQAESVSFAGPAKQVSALRQALAAGVLVNAESERELERLAQLQQETGLAARVALRINPAFELKSSGMKMGGGARQFGIDAERIPAALAWMRQHQLAFEGFHLYSGSQNLRAEYIVEAQQQSVSLMLDLAEQAETAPKLFNIGGGFGIPYFPGDLPLAIEPIAAGLAELDERVRQRLPQTRLALELGRYLVGLAGVYCCRVVDRKVSRDQVFLMTNGGMHHHLAASGNFGQILRKNYPVCVATRMDALEREVATVVGPLCTPLDLLADKMALAPADVGDWIAVFSSGAYGASASPQAFLSQTPPLEFLV